MQLKEFYDYKNRLMMDLCCNKEVVQLMTGKSDPTVPNHDLPYTQIFPFEYIPETENDSRTFICCDVDIISVQNKTYYVPVIYIWVFAHKSRQRLPKGGLTVDSIVSEIDTMLNGSRFYGLGELDLDSVRRFSPITDYFGKVMTYYAKDFNRKPMQRPIPGNRKTGV